MKCLRFILIHSKTMDINITQHNLGFRIAATRCHFETFNRFFIILSNPTSFIIEVALPKLTVRISLFRRLLKPPKGLGIILLNALPALIHIRQLKHRLHVSGLSGFLQFT